MSLSELGTYRFILFMKFKYRNTNVEIKNCIFDKTFIFVDSQSND